MNGGWDLERDWWWFLLVGIQAVILTGMAIHWKRVPAVKRARPKEDETPL